MEWKMGHSRKDPQSTLPLWTKFLLSRGVGENNLFLIIVIVSNIRRDKEVNFQIPIGNIQACSQKRNI